MNLPTGRGWPSSAVSWFSSSLSIGLATISFHVCLILETFHVCLILEISRVPRIENGVEENIFDCFEWISLQNVVHKCGGFEEFVAEVNGIVNFFTEAGLYKWRVISSLCLVGAQRINLVQLDSCLEGHEVKMRWMCPDIIHLKTPEEWQELDGPFPPIFAHFTTSLDPFKATTMSAAAAKPLCCRQGKGGPSTAISPLSFVLNLPKW